MVDTHREAATEVENVIIFALRNITQSQLSPTWDFGAMNVTRGSLMLSVYVEETKTKQKLLWVTTSTKSKFSFLQIRRDFIVQSLRS